MSIFDIISNFFGANRPRLTGSRRTSVLTPQRPRPLNADANSPRKHFGNTEGCRTYQIINSEGEYITINTASNPKFHGKTWDYLLNNYAANNSIKGIVTKIIYFKGEIDKIAGFNVIIQAAGSNHKINAFLPMRFADSRIKVNDIVVCYIKEFDPDVKGKYSLVLKLKS